MKTLTTLPTVRFKDFLALDLFFFLPHPPRRARSTLQNTVSCPSTATPWFPLALAFSYYAVMVFSPTEFVSSAAFQDFVLNSSLWLLLGIPFSWAPSLAHLSWPRLSLPLDRPECV